MRFPKYGNRTYVPSQKAQRFKHGMSFFGVRHVNMLGGSLGLSKEVSNGHIWGYYIAYKGS